MHGLAKCHSVVVDIYASLGEIAFELARKDVVILEVRCRESWWPEDPIFDGTSNLPADDMAADCSGYSSRTGL
jgi:hypothetical protein